METPDGPAPPWLEEERKRAADEVAQLRAKILSSRQHEKEIQRVMAAKHARCEEELRAALSQLQALAPTSAASGASAGPGTTPPAGTSASASAAAGASAVGNEDDAVGAAVKAAVEREKDLNAIHVRTLQKELETRTAQSLAKMMTVQNELEAQRSRVAQMAAEKAAVTSEKARLTLLVQQLRTNDATAAAADDDAPHPASAELSIASRMASTAHEAKSQASELRAENERLKQQLESAQNAILRDRSRSEEVERAAAGAAAARDALATARQSRLQNPPPTDALANETERQLNMVRAAAASEQAMLRQEIARLKKAGSWVCSPIFNRQTSENKNEKK